MTVATVTWRGEILPGFTLPDVEGCPFSLERARGRTNLVVVFGGARLAQSPVGVILDELATRRAELAAEAAQVLVALTSRTDAAFQRGRWPFPVLVDKGTHIHRRVRATGAAGTPAPALFVTDRFREIYAAWHGSPLPGAKEILDWLVFINIQCPECGVPEWPR